MRKSIASVVELPPPPLTLVICLYRSSRSESTVESSPARIKAVPSSETSLNFFFITKEAVSSLR